MAGLGLTLVQVLRRRERHYFLRSEDVSDLLFQVFLALILVVGSLPAIYFSRHEAEMETERVKPILRRARSPCDDTVRVGNRLAGSGQCSLG